MILVERTPKSYNISKVVQSGHTRYDEVMKVGSEWKTNYGFCTVLEIKDYEHIKIKFNRTGYTRVYEYNKIIDAKVKDLLAPNFSGIGYLGADYKKIKKRYRKLYKIAYRVWCNMIGRCYDKTHASYHKYGAFGVTVCEAWLCFSNFFNDMRKLPGWDYDLFIARKIFLDKDKLQLDLPKSQKVYSAKTCCWLTSKENNALKDIDDQKRKFIVTYPDGTEQEHLGIKAFARENNYNVSNIFACLAGRTKTYKGMKFRYSDNV